MKKIDFSKIQDTDRMVIFTDKCPCKDFVGKKLPILDPEYNLRFDDAIDFDGGNVVYSNEIVSGNTLPTLNDLNRMGWINEWFPYECHVMVFGEGFLSYDAFCITDKFGDICGIKVRKVQDWFKDNHGVKVSADAIRWNFDAWLHDHKSGYRDEKNGYHLFTPCGCNDLSFSYTTLHPLAEDWQTTYIY